MNFDKSVSFTNSPRFFFRFLIIVGLVHLNFFDKELIVSPLEKLFIISSICFSFYFRAGAKSYAIRYKLLLVDLQDYSLCLLHL